MVLLPVSTGSVQINVLNGSSTFFVNLRALSIINIEKSFGENHFLNRDTRQLMTNVMILSAIFLNGSSTFFVNLRALSIINIKKSFGQNHSLNRDTRQLMTNVMILSAFFSN